MNPIGIMNNDMSTFIMSTKKVFEAWNDKVAEGFKNNCVEQIQRDWNVYLQEMNTRMNIFMKAEKEIDKLISEYERQYNRR